MKCVCVCGGGGGDSCLEFFVFSCSEIALLVQSHWWHGKLVSLSFSLVKQINMILVVTLSNSHCGLIVNNNRASKLNSLVLVQICCEMSNF